MNIGPITLESILEHVSMHRWNPSGWINGGEGRYPPNWQDLWSQICPSVELNILQSLCSHIPNVVGAQPRIRNSRNRISEKKKTRNHHTPSFSLRKNFYDQGLKSCNFNFHDTFLQEIQMSWTWIIRTNPARGKKCMNFVLSFKVRRMRSIICSFSVRQIRGIGLSFL